MPEVLRVKTVQKATQEWPGDSYLPSLDLSSLLWKIRLELKMSQIPSASKFNAQEAQRLTEHIGAQRVSRAV